MTTPLTQDLEGRLAVVTGASKGIGRATAELLAARGARVIAAARSLDGLPALGAEAPPGVIDTHLDVRDESSVDGLFDRIESEVGRLDILVNNAGVGVFKPADEISPEEFRDVLETNVLGACLCARRAFALMKKHGGRILHIGSTADHVPLAGSAAYGASKHALRGLSTSLTEDGKPYDIRSTLVSVGATATPIWDGVPGFSTEDMLDPTDIAQTLADIAARPLRVRIDEVRVMPPKGVL